MAKKKAAKGKRRARKGDSTIKRSQRKASDHPVQKVPTEAPAPERNGSPDKVIEINVKLRLKDTDPVGFARERCRRGGVVQATRVSGAQWRVLEGIQAAQNWPLKPSGAGGTKADALRVLLQAVSEAYEEALGKVDEVSSAD